MSFTRKYPNFFVTSTVFSSTCVQHFGRTVAKKCSVVGFMFVQGATQSENVHLLHNTAFANFANSL